MSVIIAIPSIATMFSSIPADFSLSDKALEALPISTDPDVTDSIPAPEPVYSVVTVTLGYSSMNASMRAPHIFSIDVLPAN